MKCGKCGDCLVDNFQECKACCNGNEKACIKKTCIFGELKVRIFHNLLTTLYLTDLDKEIVANLKKQSRNQSKSYFWHELRRHRIIASHFHEVCHATDKGAKSLVQRILHPVNVSSKPTRHG